MANPAATPIADSHKLLDPSELGTREYWDAAYTREIQNHQEDAEDEGTVWFSENNAEETVQTHLAEFNERGLISRNCRILDLGTGNGHMLFALREEDDEGQVWDGELIGVDYSAGSVRLAQQIAGRQQNDPDPENCLEDIRFELWDILSDQPGDWLGDRFDVVLDKGTFDAISLMPRPEQGPHPCTVYREKVLPLIKPGFYLFVTSCNWTKDELISWLAVDRSLVFFDEAQYPTFTFGGQTGQGVVTAVFQRHAL